MKQLTVTLLFLCALQLQAQELISSTDLNINSGPVFYTNSVGVSLEIEGTAYFPAFSFMEMVQPSTGISFLFTGTESDIHKESVVHFCANPGFTIEMMKLPTDNAIFGSLNEKDNELTLDIQVDCGLGIGYIRSELKNEVNLDMMSLLISPAVKVSLDFGSYRLHTAVEYLVEYIEGNDKRGIRIPFGISLAL